MTRSALARAALLASAIAAAFCTSGASSAAGKEPPEPEPLPDVSTIVDEEAVGVPRVELQQQMEGSVSVVAKGMPAVSDDGKLVAIPVIADDGRGEPNLSVQIRDVSTDALVARVPILETGSGFTPTIGARIARANAKLARTSWTQTSKPTVPELKGCEEPGPRKARVGALSVEITGTQLTVDAGGSAPKLVRNVSWWVVPPRQYAPGNRCESPAYIASARLGGDGRVLLLHVGYCGFDTCWEPESGWHVVRLPEARSAAPGAKRR